ncbi:MAG TPA: phenylalanine--tRNA ligase subunit beta [Mycobacteriales bacterium]
MRVPLSWLIEAVPALRDEPAAEVADRLTRAGVEVEEIHVTGPVDVDGLVVGEVEQLEELTEFSKPIRHCLVRLSTSDTPDAVRSIVCGATNFAVGDRVVVATPGAVLPGGIRIGSRKTYGHLSDGMICSAAELGLGDDHTGILVLPPEAPIGADAVALLGLHDAVLVTEPTPDRGYQLSVRGLGRELAALTDTPYVDPARVEPLPPAGDGFPVRLADDVVRDGACDRFCARVIHGFDPVAPSPLWLQARLAKSGMRPISLAVDVTNYVMLLLGQPMHAYDRARLAEPITVRRAAAGDTLTTLDGVQRDLAVGADLLITDAKRVQGIAGVMGGADSEVSAATTELLLEAAHFGPRVTSRSVRRHALLSEAGRRFERGVDPQLPPAAIELATRLLVEYGGGSAEDVITDVGAVPAVEPIRVDPAGIGRLVGVPYPTEVVTRRLTQVGCVVSDGGAVLEVAAPPWRPDLVELPDLAEEVARLEGYDAIPPVLPRAAAGHGLTSRQRRRRSVSRGVADHGYVETPSVSFQSAEVFDALRLPADDPRRRLVRIANPISAEQPYLRSTLLPGLLATLVRNLGRGAEELALFETGTVFSEPEGGRPPAPVLAGARRPDPAELAALDAALPIQREHLAVALTGRVEPAGWWGPGRAASWADAVDVARLAVSAAGARSDVRAANRAPWHPGRCAALVVGTPDGELVVGYAGELHPAVCEALELPARTVAAEIDLGAALDAAVDEPSAPRVSPYPPATRDVALVVDADVPAAQVEAALRAGAGELLEDVRLFDVFSGAQVGEGRKSLAYTLRFRAPDHTLTAEEATALRDEAVAEAARRTRAVLRT